MWSLCSLLLLHCVRIPTPPPVCKVCSLCGAEETVNHALGGWRFYTAITHVLSVHGSTGTQGVSTVDLFVQKNAAFTMKTLTGVMA